MGRSSSTSSRAGAFPTGRALTPRRSPIASVVRYLYEDLGFLGNSRDYYDPRNSYLSDVLDRLTGIPVDIEPKFTTAAQLSDR